MKSCIIYAPVRWIVAFPPSTISAVFPGTSCSALYILELSKYHYVNPVKGFEI